MKKIYLSILLLFSFASNAQLTFTVTYTPISCYSLRSQIIFIANGGVTPYSYSIDGINSGNPQTDNNFFNVPAGVYNCRVIDATGAIAELNNIVIEAYTPVVSTISSGATSDSVILGATAGRPPYKYSVDNLPSTTNNFFNNLSVGNHVFTVFDSFNCQQSILYTVLATALGLNVASTEPTCSGDSNATLLLSPVGGLAPFQYSVNGSVPTTNNFFSGLAAGNYTASVFDAAGYVNSLSYTIVDKLPLISTTNIVNTDIIVNTTGGNPPYQYSINNGIFQTNNVFAGLPVGSYTIQTVDNLGCSYTIDAVVNVAPPLVNNSSVATVNFPNSGSTLADINVQGSNITWYANPGTNRPSSNGKKNNLDTPLPLTTVLENNTTYYASQTINGFESQQRLAVLVTIGVILSTNENVFETLVHYPNPVKNSFFISNKSFEIQELDVMDLSGKTIMSKKINAFKSEIDFSSLHYGIYFVKIKAQDFEKMIKVFKE
jgi:hypothetical protein